MWERYNEEFELNAKIVAMSQLSDRSELDLHDYEARETTMRRAGREQSRRATPAQKWIDERLPELFRLTEDAALHAQIPPVEAALRADGLPLSVKRELAGLYKRKLAGLELWQEAAKIYTQHDLKNRPAVENEVVDDWPQIVCSLALI